MLKFSWTSSNYSNICELYTCVILNPNPNPDAKVPMQRECKICRNKLVNADLLRLGRRFFGHDDGQDAVFQAGAHCILIDTGWEGESSLELAR